MGGSCSSQTAKTHPEVQQTTISVKEAKQDLDATAAASKETLLNGANVAAADIEEDLDSGAQSIVTTVTMPGKTAAAAATDAANAATTAAAIEMDDAKSMALDAKNTVVLAAPPPLGGPTGHVLAVSGSSAPTHLPPVTGVSSSAMGSAATAIRSSAPALTIDTNMQESAAAAALPMGVVLDAKQPQDESKGDAKAAAALEVDFATEKRAFEDNDGSQPLFTAGTDRTYAMQKDYKFPLVEDGKVLPPIGVFLRNLMNDEGGTAQVKLFNVQKVNEIFNTYDLSKRGWLDEKEQHLFAMDVIPYIFSKQGHKQKKKKHFDALVPKVISAADENEDGKIDRIEFRNFLCAFSHNA
jgi:hypothetical protein